MSLVLDTTIMKWSKQNKKYYQEKGYILTNIDDEFEVKISDLSKGTRAYVDVVCDYCGKIKGMRYPDYIRTQNEYIKKDACMECMYVKRAEILDYRIENKLIEKNEKEYYSIRENRLKALKQYIDENNTLTGMGKDEKGRKIHYAFQIKGEDIYEVVEELGYNLLDLKTHVPNGYYEDFSRVEEKINEFIKQENRFPSMGEIVDELKISACFIKYHGGMYEIRRKMNYSNENDLIDDLGFYNASRYELIVSQFLIHHTDITYKREQYPFPSEEGKYRSDFTFYKTDGNLIHVEVWGGVGNNKYFDYDDVMNEKIKLYEKYCIEYISIYPNDISGSINRCKNNLVKIFKPYVDLDFKQMDMIFTKPSSKMTDEEILDEILEFSKDKITLPSETFLRENGKGVLCAIIVKRYKSYMEFANKYGYKTNHKFNNYWTLKEIFNRFDYMIKTYGKILSTVEMRKSTDEYLRNLYDRMLVYGGIIDLKLQYFNDNLSMINEDTTIWLTKIINNEGRNIKGLVNEENKNLAQQILSKLNTQSPKAS